LVSIRDRKVLVSIGDRNVGLQLRPEHLVSIRDQPILVSSRDHCAKAGL